MHGKGQGQQGIIKERSICYLISVFFPAICIGNHKAEKHLERASSLLIHSYPIFKYQDLCLDLLFLFLSACPYLKSQHLQSRTNSFQLINEDDESHGSLYILLHTWKSLSNQSSLINRLATIIFTFPQPSYLLIFRFLLTGASLITFRTYCNSLVL